MFEVQSFGLHNAPQSFCHLFIALSIIHCRNQPIHSPFGCVMSLLLW